jgi:hypothetical protein
MMVNAMIDMSEAKDKPTKLGFVSDWLKPALNGERKYAGWQMEEVCWKLLDYAEQLHDPRFHPTTLERAQKSESLTFGKRIEMLYTMFRKQKSRVNSIVKGDMRKTLVVTVEPRLRESKIINNRRPKTAGETANEATSTAGAPKNSMSVCKRVPKWVQL